MRVACVSARGGRRRRGPPDGAPWRRPPCAHTGLSDIHCLPVCIVYSVKKPGRNAALTVVLFFVDEVRVLVARRVRLRVAPRPRSRGRDPLAPTTILYSNNHATSQKVRRARSPSTRVPRDPRPPRAARARSKVISMHTPAVYAR